MTQRSFSCNLKKNVVVSSADRTLDMELMGRYEDTKTKYAFLLLLTFQLKFFCHTEVHDQNSNTFS